MRASVFAVLASVLILAAGAGAARAQEANPYPGLRAKALQTRPADVGVTSPDDAVSVSVYGVVMDMGLPEGTATLVGFSSGDAGLYLSSGGGVIGGAQYPEVSRTAVAWIKVVQAHLNAFGPATSDDLPPDGTARLFVLTNRGVLTADASEDDLEAGGVELSPVWTGGQLLLDGLKNTVDHHH
jgi:hypothetical protein